jgi:hypothetical protein
MLLGMLALPVIAFADNGVNVAVKIGRENITVGDVIPLQIVVTHPQGWRVVFPKLETAWGDLEIRKQGAPTLTQNVDGTETTTLQIDAAAFRPGAATTPELSLKIADAQGQVHELYAAPVSVEVQSVLTQDDQELRDIKPQAELWQLTSSPLPLIGSVLLASSILVGAAVVAWKHRPLQDKRTPRQRALDYLKALDAVALDERMNVKFLAVRVSDVLRDYLANGCRIPAHDLTTGELAHELATRGVPQDIALQIVRVLRVCDDVKFANDLSDMDAIRTLTLTARNIVANYPPQPEPSSKRGSRKIIEVKP